MQEFTGLDYIKIDAANKFGLDKENWDTRIEWFNDNKHMLRDIKDEAEEPAQFYASVLGYEKAIKRIPSGIPISLDATASGSQILCALAGDIEGGKLCNIIDTGNRLDLYTEIYAYMRDEYALPEGISRNLVKKAIMTALYASVAVPRKVFGKKYLQQFYMTMNTKMSGAWKLNMLMLKLWDSEVEGYEWTLPDNFTASFKVMTDVVEKFSVNGKEYQSVYKEQGTAESGRALSANVVHSIDSYMVREITARAMTPKYIIKRVVNLLNGKKVKETIKEEDTVVVDSINKQWARTGILSARCLEHLNSENLHLIDRKALINLINTLPAKNFEVLCVHDCYLVLPNYGNDIRKLYREVLAEIADSDLLSCILQEAVGFTGTITKMSNNMGSLIRESEYALS